MNLISIKSTLHASFSGTLPPNSAVLFYTSVEAYLVSAHLSTGTIAISLIVIVSTPSGKFAQSLSTKKQYSVETSM